MKVLIFITVFITLSYSAFADSVSVNRSRHLKDLKYWRCVNDENSAASGDGVVTDAQHEKSVATCLKRVLWTAADRDAEEKREADIRKKLPAAEVFYGTLHTTMLDQVQYSEMDKQFPNIEKRVLLDAKLSEKDAYAEVASQPSRKKASMSVGTSSMKYAQYERCVTDQNKLAAGDSPASDAIMKQSSATCLSRIGWTQSDLADALMRRGDAPETGFSVDGDKRDVRPNQDSAQSGSHVGTLNPNGAGHR